MIRRAILVAAAAVALILAPTAAMADYDAPGFSSAVSDSTPTVGQPVTVTIQGGAASAGQMIKLVVTSDSSTMTLSKRANANGTAQFTFKLSSAGTFTARAFNAAGALVSDQTLTVSAKGAASGLVSGADQGSAAGGNLANTGFDSMGLVLGGGVLVLAGSGAVLVARRRRASQVPA